MEDNIDKKSISVVSGDRRRQNYNRRIKEDRRKSTDRRSGKDRRPGWGNINNHLLQGALTTAATIVFQFSRPFTIILGYVDLLLSSTKEEVTREKLLIIKDQLQIIASILNNFRELESYKTKKFDGLSLLELDDLPEKESENSENYY